MTKTILVTGGLGMIGSNFCNHINRTRPDWKQLIVDKGSYCSDRRNLDFQPEAIFQRDINQDLGDIFSTYKPKIVVHFAASSHVDNSIESPLQFVDDNTRGTASLLSFYKKYTPNSRFIFIQSDEIFGSYDRDRHDPVFKREGDRVFIDYPAYDEDEYFQPSSPYSASKAAAELILDSFVATYKLNNIVTLRCTNNYGPRQYKEKLIPKIITNALADKSIPIYGDGQQLRDWLYVEDFCKAIELVCLKDKPLYKKYNISANNEKTNLEVVKTILTKLNKSDKLIEYVKDRPAHDERYYIDSSRFRTEFGWKPQTDWETGIDATINWFTS